MTAWSFLEESWATFLTRAASFLPTLVATGLLLILGWLISRLIAAVVAQFLKRIRLDSWLDRSDAARALELGETAPSPTRVISRLVFWLFFVSFVVIAMEKLGLELSALPVEEFVAYLPVALGAVVLLMAGVLVASFLARGAESALREMGVEHPGRIGRVIKGLIIGLTAIIVVEQLGFDVTALTQTFSHLVVVVVAGLVLAFAWGGREVARNVLAGYYIREQFEQGDRIQVDGYEGDLMEIGSLSSRLANDEGEVVVPNSRLIEQTVAKRKR
jgi:small-conductance mechanosensitive channel